MPLVVLANAIWCLVSRLAFLLGVELFHAECPGIVEACEFGCRGKYLQGHECWRQMPCVVEANAFGCGGKCP